MEKTKKCPYCGEEIMAVAKKCKHCGEWLDTEPSIKEPQIKPQENNNSKSKQKNKSNKKVVAFVSCATLFVIISIFAVRYIMEYNEESKWDNLEKSLLSQRAREIKENDISDNLKFFDTPIGGRIEKFMEKLRANHPDIFSSEPEWKNDKKEVSWIGSFMNLEECTYVVIADEEHIVSYINIDKNTNNIQDSNEILKYFCEEYGESQQRVLEGYKTMFRWDTENGLIDYDYYVTLNKINIQFSGKKRREFVLKVDGI